MNEAGTERGERAGAATIPATVMPTVTPTVTSTVTSTVAAAMTHRPVSVRPDTPFESIAAILSANRVSAVPVVDDTGRPVGVVSELDLIRGRSLARPTARELMTVPVVTVPPDEPLDTAARRLSRARVRRLFVVEDGRLAGVLTRGDLLRGYLRDDDEIRGQVERAVRELLPGAEVGVTVHDGVVLLLGRAEYRSALSGVDEVAGAVPGVVVVRNRITFRWDDRPRAAR